MKISDVRVYRNKERKKNKWIIIYLIIISLLFNTNKVAVPHNEANKKQKISMKNKKIWGKKKLLPTTPISCDLLNTILRLERIVVCSGFDGDANKINKTNKRERR